MIRVATTASAIEAALTSPDADQGEPANAVDGLFAIAAATHDAYGAELKRAGRGEITTEIAPAGPFYYAEEYHQQYLHKVPNGYCHTTSTGLACPIPAGVALDR